MKFVRPSAAAALAAALAAAVPPAHAAWTTILSSDFAAGSGWTYAGVTNVNGQALIRHDPLGGNVAATWDPALGLDTGTDPMRIVTSSLSAPLGRTLTDTNTFRVRVKLRLATLVGRGYYQIANFGLFNPAQMGNDRTRIDDWAATATKVPNAIHLAEFNYFINEPDAWSPGGGASPSVVGHDNAYFAYGDDEHALGANLLPAATDLFAELSYSAATRRALATVYTDAAFTQVLTVGGVAVQEASAIALDPAAHFALTHAGFFNYQATDWMTGQGLTGVGGSGTFDDLTVEVDAIPEPVAAGLAAAGLAAAAAARRAARRG